MARGNLAAYDSIFWCHHSFLDYIWELFRRRIQNAPADYSFGYPSHGPNDLMRFDNYRYRPNPPISNQAGYSNRYARLRQYGPAPSCANDCLNSPDLYCSININRCISRESTQVSTAAAVPIGASFRGTTGTGFTDTVGSSDGIASEITLRNIAEDMQRNSPPGPPNLFENSFIDPHTGSMIISDTIGL